jgi:hypothetical protein
VNYIYAYALIAYLAAGCVAFLMYDRFVYRKLNRRINGYSAAMSMDDWHRVNRCTALFQVDSWLTLFLFAALAYFLWPVVLMIMEVKRHIANRILKKYGRDQK